MTQFNKEKILAVQKGEAAISEANHNYILLCRVVKEVSPRISFWGNEKYYFKKNNKWKTSDTLPASMTAIPLSQFVEEERYEAYNPDSGTYHPPIYNPDNVKLNPEEEKEVTGWISVEERLPEKDVNVFFFTELKYLGNGYMADNVFIELFTGNVFDNVTHWMSLPEPPKNSKQ